MRDEGLDGARDGGEVKVQPDQGRPVVNRESSPLSSEQIQERRQSSGDGCGGTDRVQSRAPLVNASSRRIALGRGESRCRDEGFSIAAVQTGSLRGKG